MDNSYVWRSRTRIVVFIDLFMSTLTFVLTLVAILFTTRAAVVISDDLPFNDFTEEDDPDMSVLIIYWILIGILGILMCIDVWAAILLLKATTLGASVDPVVTLKRARIMRNVAIFLLLFWVALRVFSQDWFSLATSIIFRAVFLCIICKFIQELRQRSAVGTPSTLPRTGVAVAIVPKV